MEENISLRQLLTILVRRMKLIVAITLIFLASGWLITKYAIPATYETSTQLIVTPSSNSGEVYSSRDQLINTYSVVITSPRILQQVINELSLNQTPASLKESVSVKSEGQSQVVAIRVKATNPELAMQIADTIAEVFQREIIEIMNFNNLSVLTPAEMPISPVSPRLFLNMILSFLVGVGIAVGFSLLLEFFNNKVQTDEDIERELGLPVLGTVMTINVKKVDMKSPKINAISRNKEFLEGGEPVES